jgi:hypothetical protein
MEKFKRNVVVLDNGGKTIDRYTVIIRKTADIYGCSENPFQPNGIGNYSCNVNQIYNMSNNTETKNRLAVNIYLRNSKSIGKRISDLNTLPENVKKYINQICE